MFTPEPGGIGPAYTGRWRASHLRDITPCSPPALSFLELEAKEAMGIVLGRAKYGV